MSAAARSGPVRALFVHAHPDDESITTGGTMAQLVDAGAQVTLLTASRGEGGEVIGAAHQHLEGDRAGLAAHREGELARAMAALGVADHRFLAPVAGRFEDSGMEWGPDGHARAPRHMPPGALCRAPAEAPAALIRAVVEEIRPHLVITYAADGGYGHPDHRRVHEAVVAALAGLRGRIEPTLLFVETPAEAVAAAFDPTRPGFELTGFDPAPAPANFPAQAPIAVAQDVSAVLGRKAMAMAAHATQITVAGEFFALSNNLGQAIGAVEYFSHAAYPGPEPMPGAPYASVLDVAAPDAAVGGDFAERGAETERGAAPDLAAGPRGAAGTGASAAAEGPAGAAGAGGCAAAGSAGGAGHGATGAEPAADPAEPEASAAAPRPAGRPRLSPWAVIHTLLVAVLVAFLGTMQHLNATAVSLGGQQLVLPWGLVLALALAAAAMWHVSVLYRSTMLLVVTAVIISLGSFALGQPGLLPGHDLLVVNTLRSVGWLFGPMLIAAVLAFALPSLKRRPARP